jgi:replicative DNA helicase Mcm
MTYVEANYIQISEESFYDIKLSDNDILEIKQFVDKNRENLIPKIYEMLFDGVYGRSKIKEGLTLQAFGGVSNYNSTPKVRGDIHILLVGDAGQNKSAFLEYVSRFHPKCKLAVGKTVSAVGLSGATIRDELSGSYMLKPGVIPLANNGIACIDELDKMNLEDRDILHEPMEQQVISISKANLADRKMLARESFLISMNPKNSYFNEFDQVYEQIDLPTTLLNRFDLVYILKKNKDKSDEAKKREKEKARIMMTRSNEERQNKLVEFHQFIRRYIAYAKQNIHPKFSKYLEEDYLPEVYAQFDHDKKSGEPGKQGFPISARHLFVIKRLAEARRRIYLEEQITVDDVDYAIDKLRESLMDIAIDVHTGKLDEDWVVDGVAGQTKKLIHEFDVVADEIEQGNLIELEELIKKLEEKGFERVKIEELVDKKKKYGDILFPRGYEFFQRNTR